ncbi:MAG TPA: OmpA family protein [bacterium]|nr:OmpA family protein [bacterium]
MFLGQKRVVWVLGLVLLVCCFSGCRCRKPLPPPVGPTDAGTTQQTDQTGYQPDSTGVSQTDTIPRVDAQVEEIEVPELKMVHFDYDRAEVRAADEPILRANAEWLKANMQTFDMIKIEGHCDERGTNKYNMVLGERRANAVREYLGSQGIPLSIIIPVSYGEERPLDPGHTEASWAQNRRAEFRIVVEK